MSRHVSSGRLSVVGIGPGNLDECTPRAQRVLATARYLYGYTPYLQRLHIAADQHCIASDNRVEAQRARDALERAAQGEHVAMVSGGDPGVFAMASAVCEQIEQGPPAWRQLAVDFIPGVTAMVAVAASWGAPLGHDFCVLSLSDNLKPWEDVLKRLNAAVVGDFVIAVYNPRSNARPWQLDAAFDYLRQRLPGDTLVLFGRAIGRSAATQWLTQLAKASSKGVDMATLIIIGTQATRHIEREGTFPLVYTPRSVL